MVCCVLYYDSVDKYVRFYVLYKITRRQIVPSQISMYNCSYGSNFGRLCLKIETGILGVTTITLLSRPL